MTRWRNGSEAHQMALPARCRVTLCPADPPPGDPGGDHADEVLPLALRPGLDAGGHDQGALALVVHMVGRPLDQDAPALARFVVKLVDLERDLVLGVRD